MGALAAIMSWLHISAAVAAVGGVAFILMTLRPSAMAALEPPVMGKLMGQIARRFRWIVWGAIAGFTVTGLWLATAYRGINTGAELTANSYGRTLLVKSILALVLFASAFAVTLPIKQLAWFRAHALQFQRLNLTLAFIIILLAAFMVRAGGLF